MYTKLLTRRVSIRIFQPMQILGYQDYRPYLRGVLEQRVATNPRYSLRAFARDLGISPQMLSFVINKKKGISAHVAAKIADRLELDPKAANHFVDLVTLVHARNAEAKKLAQLRINERLSTGAAFKTLELDAFQAISDWHHYALLELTYLPGFKSDPKWIAARLGISTFEVNQAIERLSNLELIEKDARGVLKKTDHNLSTTYGVPSPALRKLSRQLLQKAIDSLETQSIEERDLTNITMAIDPNLIPKAKEMITQFRRKLCAFLEQGERTEVYTFTPALFRLSQTEKKKRSV